MSKLFHTLVPNGPLYRRLDGDPNRGDLFLARSKLSGFWSKKVFAPGLATPSLVSSQTGAIERLLFAFPPFALDEADSVAA